VSSTISQSTILHVFLVFFLALPFLVSLASSFTLSYLNCSFTFHASRSRHDLPRPCGFRVWLLAFSVYPPHAQPLSVWAAADTQDQIALDAQTQIQTQTQLSLSLHTNLHDTATDTLQRNVHKSHFSEIHIPTMVLYTYRLSTPHFIHYPILSITRLGFLIPTELHKCLRAPCNYRFLLPPLIVLVLVVPFLPLALLAFPTYPKSPCTSLSV